jgi:GNAT superfamily N-acetyltransferase
VDVLRDVDDQRLGIATQDNLFELFRAMASLPGGQIQDGDGVSMHHAPVPNPMFNGVWATRLEPEDVDRAVDEALAWFAERDAAFWFWWTGPGSSPADLGERLAARGLRSMAEQTEELTPGILAAERGSPCMVADLASMDPSLAEGPDGFDIAEVATEEDLGAFVDVLTDAMTIPQPIAAAWAGAARSVGIGSTPWRMYLGRLDGEPVATNMLFNGAGVASIYGVATRDEVRGRGIGGAISLAPLLHARDQGYEHAVLFSSLMGIHAYERIGFRLTPVWLDRYLWMPPNMGA